MSNVDWTWAVTDQLSWHWQNQLRPRLAGLTDAEYFWEPVAPPAICWSVRPRGTSQAPMAAGGGDLTIDFAFPPPQPAPVTTIAWRLGHIIVGVLGARVHSHFGGPAIDYASHHYAGTAAEALSQLDEQIDAWLAGVATLSPERLAEPCGPAEGPWAAAPIAQLVLHINREVIHHGAEIALLRDLYAATPADPADLQRSDPTS